MLNELTRQSNLIYSEDGGVEVDMLIANETIWAKQKSIAELFDVNHSGVVRHIKNIFESGELDENITNAQKMHIANSDKPVQFYSLDVIISIGYRVNSKKATLFRKWSTGVIKQFLKNGYVIDERRLRDDPQTLNKLAAKIRALRAEEKNIYNSVRECFKISASDYDTNSPTVKSFYGKLQDKFHHAIVGMTASKIIMDRADHTLPNMGLQAVDGVATLTTAKVGKNYLLPDEIYRMHLLSEQFLLFAESTALAGKKMTMEQLHQQLDNLLTLNGYPVLEGYKDYLKDEAMRHAEREYQQYEKIEKLRLSGINVNLEDFYDGEYEETFLELGLEHKRLSSLRVKALTSK